MEVSALQRLLLSEFDLKNTKLGQNLCPLYRVSALWCVRLSEIPLYLPLLFKPNSTCLERVVSKYRIHVINKYLICLISFFQRCEGMGGKVYWGEFFSSRLERDQKSGKWSVSLGGLRGIIFSLQLQFCSLYCVRQKQTTYLRSP